MLRIVFSAIALFLLVYTPAFGAYEVLVVQNCRARPYAEALQGFTSACKANIRELVLSEMNGEDVAAEIRRRKPDLILAIGMEALLKARKIREKPVVYMMVLNPDSVLRDEKNITGVSMIVPPERQLSALRKVLPQVKKVGLVYNRKTSGRMVERARRSAARMGLELTALKADGPGDFPGLLRSMKGNIDAYWMLPDSTAIAPEIVEDLFLFSMRNRIPVFTFSDKYLKMGALLSFQANSARLGKQAGEMAWKILSGTPIVELAETETADAILTANHKIAKKMGISIHYDTSAKTGFRFREMTVSN